MTRPFAITIAIFALALIVMAATPSVVSAETEPSPSADACADSGTCEAETNEPAENQGCVTVTGIVKLTILPPPVICGDGICSRSETCSSCPVDCGRCETAFGLTGLATGATGLSLSGLAGILAIAMLSMTLVFTPCKKNN